MRASLCIKRRRRTDRRRHIIGNKSIRNASKKIWKSGSKTDLTRREKRKRSESRVRKREERDTLIARRSDTRSLKGRKRSD